MFAVATSHSGSETGLNNIQHRAAEVTTAHHQRPLTAANASYSKSLGEGPTPQIHSTTVCLGDHSHSNLPTHCAQTGCNGGRIW